MPRLRTHLAFAAVLAIAEVPTELPAQVSRDWSVCFTSGVSTCTDLRLTTSSFSPFGSRIGTFISVLARQHDGSLPSALMDATFWFDPSPEASVAMSHDAFASFFGMGGAAGASSWEALAAMDPRQASGNALVLSGNPPVYMPPQWTTWLGGCGAPFADSFYEVTSWSCGPTEYFRLGYISPVVLDADRVTALALDVYAKGLLGDDPNVGPIPGVGSCYASAAGGAGVGYDGIDPSNATPCVLRTTPFFTPTPEPTPALLLGGALAGLGVVIRRRRTA